MAELTPGDAALTSRRPTGRPVSTVACIGEAMVVLSPAGGAALESAELLHRSVGGAEANVARMLAALGVRACFVSRVGDDPFGRSVRTDLRSHGVDDGLVEVDAQRSTGLYVKSVGPHGSAMFYYRSSSAATAMGESFFGSPTVRGCLADAGVVHTSGITAGIVDHPDALLDALRRSRTAGALVSVDLNWRSALWRGREHAPLLDLLRVADLVFVGADEARSALGTDNPHSLRAFVAPHAAIVIKSDSHSATAVAADGSQVAVPALAVDVAEPVGAGDAFAGGYLAGQVLGLSMTQRLRLGHLCAAMVLVSADDHAPPPPGAIRNTLLSCSDDEWGAVHVGPQGLTGLPAPRHVRDEKLQ